MELHLAGAETHSRVGTRSVMHWSSSTNSTFSLDMPHNEHPREGWALIYSFVSWCSDNTMYSHNYLILRLRQSLRLSSVRFSPYYILLKQFSAVRIRGPIYGWRHLRNGREFMRHSHLRLPVRMSPVPETAPKDWRRACSLCNHHILRAEVVNPGQGFTFPQVPVPPAVNSQSSTSCSPKQLSQ